MLRQMPDESVDAIITDPPYGINYHTKGTGASIKNDKSPFIWFLYDAFRVLKSGDSGRGSLICFTRWDVEQTFIDAMKLAGIYEQRNKAPHKLSGGQKQRVAIAGVIAMRPDCLILDESTAMLDPRGRAQVMKTIRNLRDAGISIVSITHYMEEAAQADRILVMSRGRIVMEGTPKQVFSQTKRLHGYHLDVPQATELRDELAAAGLPMPENIITPEECAKAIFDLLK